MHALWSIKSLNPPGFKKLEEGKLKSQAADIFLSSIGAHVL